MTSTWNIPGLSLRLRKTYAVLSKSRQRITLDGKSVIVYAGALTNVLDDVARLIQLGLVERRKVGKRTLLLLGTWEVVEKRFADGHVKVSTIFTEGMVPLLERYDESQRKVIERAFILFGSIRKGNKAASSVLLRQLQAYERFPANAVIDGLRIYTEGDYAERSMNERYALGIIRGCSRSMSVQVEPDEFEYVQVAGSQQVEDQRELKRKEREEIDTTVASLIQQEYGNDVNVGDLPTHVVSRFVQLARSQVNPQ